MNEDTIGFIKNFFFKRDAIFRNYTRYGDECDAQAYFLGQLETNPKLLAWLFDDPSLYGKSPLELDDARYVEYQYFYDALYLDIYGDNKW